MPLERLFPVVLHWVRVPADDQSIAVGEYFDERCQSQIPSLPCISTLKKPYSRLAYSKKNTLETS
jgi:hypothetical protein